MTSSVNSTLAVGARGRPMVLWLFAWAILACSDPEPTASESADAPAEPEREVVLDLWSGVPPLEPHPGDVATAITPRPSPEKPPVAAETISAAFPPVEVPPESAPTVTTGPLVVERFGPEGDRGLVDAVHVTFNQPMVPLASVESLATKAVPLVITPAIPGKSRWLGTRTVAFYPEGRLPLSTTYTATVPAGTKSMAGNELGRAHTWTISTAVLDMVATQPYDGATGESLDRDVVITFNQPVQRAKVVAAMTWRAGSKKVAFREADPVDAAKLEPWQRDRIVRLVPEGELAPDTRYTVSLPAGVYGEGPLRSEALSLSFSTYPPLAIRAPDCGGPCSPEGFSLPATTQIVDAKLGEKVRVVPPVADLVVSSAYHGISLRGAFEGEATYTITVDAGVADVHGQTLAKTFTTKLKLGPQPMSLALAHRVGKPAVIERGAAPELDLKVSGISTIEVSGIPLTTGDLVTYLRHVTSGGQYDWPASAGTPAWTKTFDVAASRRRRTDFALPVGDLLGRNSIGWVVARSEPHKTTGYRTGLEQVVVVTDLGIATAVDGDSATVWVTRLSTGEPVADAKVSVMNDGRATWSGTTDAEGLAYATYSSVSGTPFVTAQTADDAAFVPLDRTDILGDYLRDIDESAQPLAFFFTDREPYKPGETIHLVGILRQRSAGPKSATAWWLTGADATYTLYDPRGIEVTKGETKIGALGTIAVDLPTKPDGGTGRHRFELTVPGVLGEKRFSHVVAVETYRTPEFVVKVERTSSKPLVYGETLAVEVKGEYLHGAPLVGGAVDWAMTRVDTDFKPPGAHNDGFTFGIAPAWGGWGTLGGYGRGGIGRPRSSSTRIDGASGSLDARGRLAIDHVVVAQETPKPAPGAAPPPAALPTTPSEPKPPRASTYTVNATVTDANRQAIAGSGSFVVHPARMYLGVRSERNVVRVGESANLEAIAVDLEGARTSGQAITIDLVRRETTRNVVTVDGRAKFEYTTTETRTGGCALVSDAAPVTCAVVPDTAGTYVVRATAKDADGNDARTESTLHVHGADAVVWNENSDRRVDLVADKSKYAPGDTATILVRSPFADARGVVVVDREGAAATFPVVVKGGAATVEVPITEEMMGGVSLAALITRGRVEVTGVPSAQDLGIPAAAAGRLEIDVSTDSRAIAVAVVPNATEVAPKDSLSLAITTTRKDTGEPLAASVAVMVVDEGVLSLMDFKTPDPVKYFHTRRGTAVTLHALHRSLLPRDPVAPADPADVAEEDVWGGLSEDEIGEAYGVGGLGLTGTGRGGGGSGEGTIGLGDIGTIGHGAGTGTGSGYGRGAPSPAKSSIARAERGAMGAKFDAKQAMAQSVSLRTVFASTAFFDADVTTDDSGNARIDIPMPENLTTFRIMAVAVDPKQADRFGNGEASVRVRKPIMIRPAMPRFASYGDAFEGAVMVDNQTTEAQKVLVGTRGLNVELTGTNETFVEIPAGESREVRFGMRTQKVGRMRVQFAAMSNGGRDATELTVPVHYPATAKAFADYGVTDASLQRVIEPPAGALPAFGGLELSFSSTALSGLQDAVSYLVDYPYECAEQTASRILPIFALGDVLDAFPIATVRDRALRDQLGREGLAKLLTHQRRDGGFGYWLSGESHPYLTNWVVFAMLEGKRRGHTVDADALDRALTYLDEFASRATPSSWGEYYDWTSRAFAAWLLSGEGRGTAAFDAVWRRRDELPLYARAMLMSAAHRHGRTAERDEMREVLKQAVIEGARTVHLAEARSEAASDGLRLLMHSSVQTDAVALVALLEIDPADPMLPKLMAGIMDDRDPKRSGRWRSTHANAWALVAASRYFETFEKEEPDFTAKVWIDELLAGEHTMRGRSMATIDQTVAMETIQGAPTRTLVLAKDGPGKLYYRLGLRYAPADLKLTAVDNGFTVYREYEALPKADGTLDADALKQTEDGNWIVKAGTDIKVTINLVVGDRANYVVVDDPLPGGFEGLNPKFVTNANATTSSGRGRRPAIVESDGWWWGWRHVFDHTDMRDDRMLLFSDRMAAGVYTYSYSVRATTIGDFLLAPVKAEEMYEPDRFGHGSSARVTVVP